MSLSDREIRRDNRRVLRTELRNYWDSKKQLDEDIAEMVSPGCYYPENDADMIRGSDTSDPTARRAQKLMSSAELRERKRRIGAIQKVVDRLANFEPEKYRLVQMHYWNGLYTPEGVRQQLHIDRRTFERWHKQILQEVAEGLGWYI